MKSESHGTLVMTRRFDAAPESVFDAWLNPDLMRRWLFTTDGSNKVVKNDPRVGGTWLITDHRMGIDYTAEGVYLEIDRPRRLVFTFRMTQFTDSTDRIIVEIIPREHGCLMTFTQEIVMPHDWLQRELGKTEPLTAEEVEAGLANLSSASEGGWNWMFEGLAATLAS